MALALLLFAVVLIKAPASAQIKPSGKYKVTVFLPDSIDDVSVMQGDKIYLFKSRWSGKIKNIKIDSAIVSSKRSITFKGFTYDMRGDGMAERTSNKFTAGEYLIACGKQPGKSFITFFYSSLAGDNFNEVYRIERKDPLLQYDYMVKGGSENDIFFKWINIQKLKMSRILTEGEENKTIDEEIEKEFNSLKKAGEFDRTPTLLRLIDRAHRECPNALVCYYFFLYDRVRPDGNFKWNGYVLDQSLWSDIYADERLLNTSLGNYILETKMPSPARATKDSIECKINQILNNRLLTSNELKSAIVLNLFDIYKNSDIMGAESDAIYVANNYILNKKIEVPDSLFYEIQYYTKLNENTLLGMKAPALELKDTAGVSKNIRNTIGEYTIIYFYSDDCAYCKLETPKLIDFINKYTDTPLNIYAVYTGTNIEAWKKYLPNFSSYNPFVTWTHVADLAREGNFPLVYGVISTPTMYLLNREGKIIGRGIKTDEINEILLGEKKKRNNYDDFFERLLNNMHPVNTQNVKQMIDMLYEQLAGKKDENLAYGLKPRPNMNQQRKDLYCEIFRELYSDFRSSDNYALQEGAAYAGEKYICGKKEFWEDSVFVDGVEKAVRSFKMNMLGSKASDAALRDISGAPINIYDVKKDYKVLYFYNPTCGICRETSKQMKEIYSTIRNNIRAKKSKFGVEFLGIYTGGDYSAWISYVAKNGFEWKNLWDKNGDGGLRNLYDVESVPGIYLLDKDNTVIAKDITPDTLQQLLERL
jgi:peroxiredoxin